jgi:hypothetical protein
MKPSVRLAILMILVAMAAGVIALRSQNAEREARLAAPAKEGSR